MHPAINEGKEKRASGALRLLIYGRQSVLTIRQHLQAIQLKESCQYPWHSLKSWLILILFTWGFMPNFFQRHSETFTIIGTMLVAIAGATAYLNGEIKDVRQDVRNADQNILTLSQSHGQQVVDIQKQIGDLGGRVQGIEGELKRISAEGVPQKPFPLPHTGTQLPEEGLEKEPTWVAPNSSTPMPRTSPKITQ